MTEYKLRSRIGIVLVLAHFLLLASFSWPGLTDRLTFEDTTTAIALVLPFFAVHTTTIIKYFVEHSREDPQAMSSPVNGPYFVVSWVAPLMFIIYFFALGKLSRRFC